MTSRSTAYACLLAAAAWPWLVSVLANVLTSPLERATRTAWCGMPLHSNVEVLGHCPACWAGSALLVVIGMMLARRRTPVRARTSAGLVAKF